LISLGLGGVSLSFVGVNGKQERQIAEELMSQHGSAWQAKWLRTRGLSDWADYLEPVLPLPERRALCVGA
jgi:type IV secretion system protein VirB4